MPKELYLNTAAKLRDMLIKKEVSAEEIVKSFLLRLEKLESELKAFITIMYDHATQKAKHIDKKISRGESVGKLVGIPVAVKDNICVKNFPTTCGSKILENFIPPYNAYVVNQLEEEDAIIIGKTNMDEFAMGSSTENSAFFPTKNPWDLDRVPGGSSGGSAAAVSASQCCVALGSDTGGSIRQPAFFTATVGFKPTYGTVSRYGLVAFASSLDQIGPITKTVHDTRIVMEIIAKDKDPMDSTNVKSDFSSSSASEKNFEDLKNIRIGVPKEYFSEGVQHEVRDCIKYVLKIIQNLGAELVDVSLPIATEYGISAYYIVAPSEASSNLARYDGVHYGFRTEASRDIITLYSKTRSQALGQEVKRRIMLGTYALSAGYYDAYYLKALKVRRLIKEDFDRVFKEVDAIVGPTSPIVAFKLGEKITDPLQMYLCDIFTVSTNLAGLPAISIPCGFTSDKLPIGLQIHTKAFDDLKLLNIAEVIERELNVLERCLYPKGIEDEI